MRRCPACAGTSWQPFFTSTTGRVMTGDQRIGAGALAKIICRRCGVVANRDRFSQQDLELLYGEAYELNTLGREEHFFYTPAGPVARSQVFADWIAPHIPAASGRIVEVGCGEGRLLERLLTPFPAAVSGIDGSRRAVALGQARGLQIQQGLLPTASPLPAADVWLLVNVIEHVEDIPLVIAQLKSSLMPGGRIIFCLPIQDYGGYDIFFAEHVWHFTAAQFTHVLRANGLDVIHMDTAHATNHGIGLFVCTVAAAAALDEPALDQSAVQFNTLRRWEDAFERVNRWCEHAHHANLAVFGASEVFTLFSTFTAVGDLPLQACIDDTKGPGAMKHGLPVHPTEWLADHRIDVLLLAVNPRYHQQILAKVTPYGVQVYPLVT